MVLEHQGHLKLWETSPPTFFSEAIDHGAHLTREAKAEADALLRSESEGIERTPRGLLLAMVGPVMRALIRNVTASAVPASMGPYAGWQQLGFDPLGPTRTPSSTAGSLSSLSTPVVRPVDSCDSIMGDGEMSDSLEPMAVGRDLDQTVHQAPFAMTAGQPASEDDFDIDDGFALPDPAVGLQDLAMEDAEDTQVATGNTLQPLPVAGEVVAEPLRALEEKVCVEAKFAAAEIACIRGMLRSSNFAQTTPSERATLAAVVEHLMNAPPRRDLRRGAVRVGRRRVACRQRPTLPASRRFVPVR